jgi:hypothetical protein
MDWMRLLSSLVTTGLDGLLAGMGCGMEISAIIFRIPELLACLGRFRTAGTGRAAIRYREARPFCCVIATQRAVAAGVVAPRPMDCFVPRNNRAGAQ